MLDLDAYFARIDYQGPRAASADVLAAIAERHPQRIPFENLDILLGRGIRIDLASIQAKLVAGRRGGYCFEHNTLLAAVLRELGFRVTTLGARVRLGVPAEVATPRTHMLLRVDLDDGPRLVDVGFGFAPTGPLRLQPDLVQQLHLDRYRLRRDGAEWTLESGPDGGPDFAPAYVFTEEPLLPIDYEVANHYTSTHPRSHFTLGPVLVRPDVVAGCRYIFRGGELTVRRGGAAERTTISDPDVLLTVLARDFGLDFPPGTRFRSTAS